MTSVAAVGLAGTVATLDALAPQRPWADGPVVGAEEPMAYTEQLSDYLSWLAAVEGASPTRSSFVVNCSNMRQMYYNRLTKGLGTKFAVLWSGEPAPAPYSAPAVPADTLNRIYSTASIMTGPPSQHYTDLIDAPLSIGRLFAALDPAIFDPARFARYRNIAEAYAYLAGSPAMQAIADGFDDAVQGIAGWVGDLAAWFTRWNSERVAAASAGTPWSDTDMESHRQALQISTMSLEDVLGDMDGQILAADQSSGITSLVSMLQGYYVNAPVTGLGNISTRFSDFAVRVLPVIPYSGSGSGLTLDGDAGETVAGYVTTIAWVFLMYEREQSEGTIPAATSALADVTSFSAIINSIASDFISFLASGLSGTAVPNSWPSEFLQPLARYGGYYLLPGDSDTSAIYGFQQTSDTGKAYVGQLVRDLLALGITCVRPRASIALPPPTGACLPPCQNCPPPTAAVADSFDANLQWALRHFQGYAGLPGTAMITANAGPHWSDDLGPCHNPRRYRGNVHGCLTPETARALARWQSQTVVTPPTGSGSAPTTLCCQFYCPVAIEAWHSDQSVTDQIWLQSDLGAADYGATAWARDFSAYYPMPASMTDPTSRDALGLLTRYQPTQNGPYVYGPVTSAGSAQYTWNESRVTPTLLTGSPITLTGTPPAVPAAQAALASTYRAVAAVAHLECVDYVDNMNGYDAAVISFGLVHWALTTPGYSSPGELFALLSYLKSTSPDSYQKYLGVFGVMPAKDWPAQWDSSQRKYTSSPAICGNLAPLTPDNYLPVTAGPDFERFRDWHWWYRFIMMCRTSADLQHAMWDMARMRILDLLATPWAAAVGTSASIPTAPASTGGTRPAMFGEVFTSEHAVALIYRYHVNKPALVVSGGHAGASTIAALSAANIGNMDTTTWSTATQTTLVTGLRNNPPGGINSTYDDGLPAAP